MIEPSEGYRLLVEGEKIAEGDEVYDRVTCNWHKLGKLFAEIEWSAKGYASVRRKIEQQKGDDVKSNKLPEVGEFWETQGYRRKVLSVSGRQFVTIMNDGFLQLWTFSVLREWTYLPWCKSFDDAEPKPVSEEIEFREYICGLELKWLSWVPADAIPTGLVRKVKVAK